MSAFPTPVFHLAELDDVGAVASGEFVYLNPNTGLFEGTLLDVVTPEQLGTALEGYSPVGHTHCTLVGGDARVTVEDSNLAVQNPSRTEWRDVSLRHINLYGAVNPGGTTNVNRLQAINSNPDRPAGIFQSAPGQSEPLLSLRNASGVEVGNWTAGGTVLTNHVHSINNGVQLALDEGAGKLFVTAFEGISLNGANLSPYSIGRGGGSVSVDTQGRILLDGGTSIPSGEALHFGNPGSPFYHWVQIGNSLSLTESGVEDGRICATPGGRIGFGTLSPSARHHVVNSDPAQPVTIFRGASGQQEPILSLRDSSENPVGSWGSDSLALWNRPLRLRSADDSNWQIGIDYSEDYNPSGGAVKYVAENHLFRSAPLGRPNALYINGVTGQVDAHALSIQGVNLSPYSIENAGTRLSIDGDGLARLMNAPGTDWRDLAAGSLFSYKTNNFYGGFVAYGENTLDAASPSLAPLRLKGAPGQSAALLSIRNASDNELAKWRPDGYVQTPALFSYGPNANANVQIYLNDAEASVRVGAASLVPAIYSSPQLGSTSAPWNALYATYLRAGEATGNHGGNLLSIIPGGFVNPVIGVDPYGQLFGREAKFVSQNPDNEVLIVRGGSGQSKALQEWQDASGNTKSRITPEGSAHFALGAGYRGIHIYDDGSSHIDSFGPGRTLYFSGWQAVSIGKMLLYGNNSFCQSNLHFSNIEEGPVVRSPNGSHWRVSVSDDGAISAIAA